MLLRRVFGIFTLARLSTSRVGAQLGITREKTLLSALAAGILFAGTCAAAGGLSTQDYFEIQQLYARYNMAIDSGDAEGWAATFTPDGVFNTSNGHDALVNFVKNWREKLNGAMRKHWNNNLQLTGNSKEASGSVYLMLVDIGTKPASILVTGAYTDSLIKTKDGWRFTKRVVKLDTVPAAPGAAESTPPPK